MAIENGNWIKVSYTGTLKDGSVFDSSEGKDPIVFEVGTGTVIKGFDTAVVTMEVGEEKEFTIPCADAYGEASEDHQEEVPKEFFQGVEDVKVGMEFMAQSMMGPLKVKVMAYDGEKGKVAINHPLAGEDLTFKIKIESVLSEDEAKAHKEELAKKHEEYMKQMEAQACSSDSCSTCSGCGDQENLE